MLRANHLDGDGRLGRESIGSGDVKANLSVGKVIRVYINKGIQKEMSGVSESV